MNKDKVIRIIIVEDHPMVREGLASMINIQPDMKVIAEAGSGEKALELYKAHEPDLTIMDLRLPGMSGVETILEIRKDFPSARFIALTTYEADEDMYKAIKAGVQGYLLKGMHFEALLEAIRAVHSGLRRIPAEIAKRLELRVAGNELTPRELDVLRLIVGGRSNKEIASELGISEKTVKSYITNIFTKMNVSDRTQAATLAIQRGIVHLS